MKTNTMAEDYSKKNDKDLDKLLIEAKEELRGFRFGIAGSKVRDVKTGKNLKKTIARILTEKNLRVEK
jgi:ribosomal protein L29